MSAANTTLPPVLVDKGGQPISTTEAWESRREDVLADVVDTIYGGLPPAPEGVTAHLLHTHRPKIMANTTHYTYLLRIEPIGFQFEVKVYVPDAEQPRPLVITGDGCWHYLTEDILRDATSRGFAVAIFNRAFLATDNGTSQRDLGLYAHYPGSTFGAVAAWAWGYHRVIDALIDQSYVNADEIIVTGHSRGGKTALLAGATDSRIAVTNPNNSGCCGAGCFRHQGPDSEHLHHILENFPYWFAPGLKDYIGRETDLAFDMHFLKACVAPRGLLSTEALGDLWANPEGTAVSHEATLPVYDLYDATANAVMHTREGAHRQGLEDWITLFTFAKRCFSARNKG